MFITEAGQLTSAALIRPSLVRSLNRGGPANNLMSPVLHDEEMQLSPYFRPKSYTVNDFHMLVEGLRMERKNLDKQINRNVEQLVQRIQKLEERNFWIQGIWIMALDLSLFSL
uniref:Uncharacterized protein n=1 Tax=Ditylenchus dipsaci TaxID=166011 RepID=A0A915DVR9_9BILA